MRGLEKSSVTEISIGVDEFELSCRVCSILLIVLPCSVSSLSIFLHHITIFHLQPSLFIFLHFPRLVGIFFMRFVAILCVQYEQLMCLRVCVERMLKHL